jgi:hypothetical protein
MEQPHANFGETIHGSCEELDGTHGSIHGDQAHGAIHRKELFLKRPVSFYSDAHQNGRSREDARWNNVASVPMPPDADEVIDLTGSHHVEVVRRLF